MNPDSIALILVSGGNLAYSESNLVFEGETVNLESETNLEN